ncbi:MAG: hypothetical protein WDW38_004630 [Sanguina aurantia]
MEDAASANLGPRFNYVVTAHKPTAVSHSVVGHFTSPTDMNLVISRLTRLEIHTMGPDGLQGVMEVPIYGRITALELFRPKSEPKDLLFVLLEKYRFAVLRFDSDTGELETRAYGDVRDSIGRPSDNGQLAALDPDCRMIGLHIYGGMLKVMPILDRGAAAGGSSSSSLHNTPGSPLFAEAFNIRIDELELVAMTFLHACGRPTLAVLYEDSKHARHVKTYEVLVKEKTVPPLGGAIVVGEAVITYINAGTPPVSAPLRQTIMKTFGRIDEDGSRWLLSDVSGVLYLLVVVHDGSRVGGLKVEVLGKTPAAESLSYLDNSCVYVGSRLGDSVLVRLHPSPISPATDPHNYVEVLETYPNLGPIVDFCVVDLERQGQGQGVWSLRRRTADEHDAFLVLTFVAETRLLAINEADELDEACIAGFDAAAHSLYCGNTDSDQLVQVTSGGVRLVDCVSETLVGLPTQILLATGGGHLVLLSLDGTGIHEVSQVQMGSEVACLDITPVGPTSSSSPLAVVGCWDMSMALLALPSLGTLQRETLGGEVIPRSVLLSAFDGVPYVLCGMGDGTLHTWRCDTQACSLSDKKKVVLGTKPILLRTFHSNGVTHVFAASDRPTIIYASPSSHKKLLFSNLNEDEVNFMASFHSSSFPDSLAIAKEGCLTIGSIDQIQKLHVRSVPLGEQPRRVAHQEQTKTYGVLTMAVAEVEEGAGYLRILDDVTFDTVASFPLEPLEMPCSISSASFADDPSSYYVVGTAIVSPQEVEPSKGRILVLSYSAGQVTLVCEKEVRGAVYNVLPFQGKLLASVNNKVTLHRWLAREGGVAELVSECSQFGHVLALHMTVRGHFIVVGDLMRSVSLLIYKPEENTLELRAQDYISSWTTAVAMLDDDTYLSSDNSYNLMTLRKNGDAATDEDRNRLEVVGEYHLGSMVNRLRPGSLVMRLPDSELASLPTPLLYAAVDGSLGLIISLPQDLYIKLAALQEALRGVIVGVGGLDHASWRSFSNERKTCPATHTIDGDLIEAFLDLGPEKAEKVSSAMSASLGPHGHGSSGGGDGDSNSVEELTKLVEELARLH